MKQLIAILVCVLGFTSQARAGIPVIDVANLTESIQQAFSAVTQIENQIQQIQQFEAQLNQLRTQLESINGIRGLANLANNPLLHDYIPQGAPQMLTTLANGGYAGLTGLARAERDSHMLYNCTNVPDDNDRKDCELKFAMPYQQRQFFTDAMQRASTRMDQIDSLMTSASTAADPKAIAESQARLQGEQAMLTHELTNVQLMQARAVADQNVTISQSSERAAAQAAKGGDVSVLFR